VRVAACRRACRASLDHRAPTPRPKDRRPPETLSRPAAVDAACRGCGSRCSRWPSRSRGSRSSRRGSPSAWGSRTRRPRRPRPCPGLPSRERRPGRRPRVGFRRTSGASRASWPYFRVCRGMGTSGVHPCKALP
jgi:hypothetical protein